MHTGKTRLLFDAGLRLPKLETYLANDGVSPSSLSAVLISHEHADHCLSARDLAFEHGTPIWSNEQVLRAAGLHDVNQASVIEVGRPLLFGDVEVTCFPVSHDSVCPVGFLVHVSSRTIAIATDLGEPTPELLEAVRVADLVVLEANHDLQMLRQGRYPHQLQRRVAGPKGHLSNDQAAGILVSNLKSDTVDVWLAHLSRENNTPHLATRTVGNAFRSAGLASVSLGVAARDRPSLRWNGVQRPRQLSLFPAWEAS